MTLFTSSRLVEPAVQSSSLGVKTREPLGRKVGLTGGGEKKQRTTERRRRGKRKDDDGFQIVYPSKPPISRSSLGMKITETSSVLTGGGSKK